MPSVKFSRNESLRDSSRYLCSACQMICFWFVHSQTPVGVEKGILCISKTLQLYISELHNGESSCRDKHWLGQCLTADVKDGNEALMDVKDPYVKYNKKRKSPEIMLRGYIYQLFMPSYTAASRSVFSSISGCAKRNIPFERWHGPLRTSMETTDMFMFLLYHWDEKYIGGHSDDKIQITFFFHSGFLAAVLHSRPSKSVFWEQIFEQQHLVEYSICNVPLIKTAFMMNFVPPPKKFLGLTLSTAPSALLQIGSFMLPHCDVVKNWRGKGVFAWREQDS